MNNYPCLIRPISELKAKLLSASVFLVASGPTVNDFPFYKHRDGFFVAMNGSICKMVEERIRPTLYLCDDPSFPENRMKLIKLALDNSDFILFSKEVLDVVFRLDENILVGRNVFLLEKVNRLNGEKVFSDRRFSWNIRKDKELVSKFSLFSPKKCSIGFSVNLEKGYFSARTIPYVALQVVHYMGAGKVYLVGMDLNQEQGRVYEKGKKALPSSLSEHYSRNIFPSFKLVSERIIKKDVFEVYNLSPSSRLPSNVIQKISYDQI